MKNTSPHTPSEARLKPIRCGLVCLALLTIAAPALAAPSASVHWPGWLGPERNGWVRYFQAPASWPTELKKRWTVDVGKGYGSPLVSGDRVYQHGRQGEEEVVWCLDRKTGDVRWKKSYRTDYTIGGGAERHGKGPKACPLLVGDRLFTLSITGVLKAWNAQTGDSLWQRDYASKFKQGHAYWGAAGSPLVDGNRIILHLGTDEVGALVALDIESGKEIWSHGKDGTCYSSPVLAEIDGVRQVIEWNHRALVGVESKSGKFLWEYPFPHEGPDQNMPTPVVHGKRVLLGGENRGILGLDPQQKDGTWSVTQRWHQKDVALDMSTAVINDGRLYGFSHYDSGRIFCLDPKTGKILWQGPGRMGDHATFLAIPGYVLALRNEGELQVLKAGASFEKIASYQLAESSWAPPALLDDGILVKDTESLTLWSLR